MNQLFIVWLILSAATLLSCWLDSALTGTAVGASIMLIAFFKTRLVLMVFMDMKRAELNLRRICDAWVLVACALVVGMYVFTSTS